MNSNEAMLNSANQIKADGIDNPDKLRGFESTATLIKELVKVKDSTEFLPLAIKKAYETYNHAEDLKDDEKEFAYEEGEYEAWEKFNRNFNNWLVDQDPHTIIKHSVNEELFVKDGVKMPKADTAEKKILFAITTFWLKGYDQDEDGKVTHVAIEVGDTLRRFTFYEFSKLFDHVQLCYLKN